MANDMKYWFVRLGKKADSYGLYQTLAREHSIIKIGYGINEDLTKYSKEELDEYFSNENIKYEDAEDKKNRSPQVVALIKKFIHDIKVGHIIISPFDTHYIRIGKVARVRATLESFFENKNELEKILKRYSHDKRDGDPRIQPAIEIEWLTRELDIDEFSAPVRKKLTKDVSHATITNLRLEEAITPPNDTDKDEMEVVGGDEIEATDGDEKKAAIKKAVKEAVKVATEEAINIATLEFIKSKITESRSGKNLKTIGKQEEFNKTWAYRVDKTALITAFYTAVITGYFSALAIGAVNACMIKGGNCIEWIFLFLGNVALGILIILFAKLQRWSILANKEQSFIWEFELIQNNTEKTGE